MRPLLCLLATLTLGVAFAQEGVIDVPFTDGKWGPAPDWCAYEKAAKYEMVPEQGYTSFRASGGKGTMIWLRYPDPRLDVSKMRFVTFRYRTTNIVPDLYSYLLYLDTGDSGRMLARNLIFGANDLQNDGQWHTATTQLPAFGQIGAIALRFRAQEGKDASLDVAYLRFTADPPRNSLAEVLPWKPGTDGIGDFAVSLEDMLQRDVAQVQTALDLSDWFDTNEVVIKGVNFNVEPKDLTAIGTGDEAREAMTVPVGARGAALYLLLGAKFPYKMLTYEGWQPGDMTDRPQQCEVVVNYDDGTRDEQVPYCLSRGAHGVWRGLQVYCLPLDARKDVRDFELRDGMRSASFYLAAATVADKSLSPASTDPAVLTPAGRGPAKMKPAVLRQGQALLLQGPWGEIALGYRDGLALTAASNAAHPEWALKVPGRVPLFSVREGDSTWGSADFTITDPKLDFYGTKGVVHLDHKAAQLQAVLTLESTATEARLGLTVTNTADKPRDLRIIFPEVELSTSRPADLWYFYPTASPIWTNVDRAYDTAYSGWLPAQFQDVYDRAKGGGLYLGTRDRSLTQRYYQLSKAGNMARLAIEYRDRPLVAAGETVTLPGAVLGLHGGDWRPAWNAYLAWFRSWYKPVQPRLAWYRKIWNFRTWWTHTLADGRPDVNLLDKSTGELRPEMFLKKDRDLFGQVDMVHFFDWRISETHGRYGDYTYDGCGGLEKFRAAIQKLQADGVRVGLYMDCYLVSRKSDVGRAHGKEWALADRTGRLGDAYSTPEDPMYSVCVNHPGWQDYLSDKAAQVAKDTGCDGIYLDEGMTDLPGYWCWSKDHGHPVPAPTQPGLLELARKTRAKLPPNVALYTEWSPPDAILPYLDGAYQANLGRSDVHLAPGFAQLARFMAPDFKVFTISNGGSMYDGIWEGTQYNFFSGVPLYTLSYGHDDEAYPLIRKMSKLLHDHQDAFLTAAPQLFVPNLRSDLYCNAFPGQKETVWTLWNGRFRTLNGPVLKVKHVPGARYVDLWNDRELKPTVGRDGMVTLTTTLAPRSIGAVVQLRP